MVKRNFYRSWGIPVAKSFLGALFTYQVIYFGWLSLEDYETRQTKDGTSDSLDIRIDVKR